MSPPRALKLLSNSVIVERDVFTRAPTEPVTAHAVGHYPLVLLTRDFATHGYIDAYFVEHRVTPRIAMETSSIQALTEIVRHTPLATCCPTQSPTSTRTSPPPRSTRPFPSAPSSCSPARAPTKPPALEHSPASPRNTSEHTSSTIPSESRNTLAHSDCHPAVGAAS